MLLLSRKEGQAIVIQATDGPIEIKVTAIDGGRVKLGIEADKSIQIMRREVMSEPNT